MIQKFPLLGTYLSIYPKESQGNFLDDRNVLYLDDGGDYMGIYLCRNWVNGTGCDGGEGDGMLLPRLGCRNL